MESSLNHLESNDPLARRMAALGILEADLDETFICSGGNGGQNVNKVSTCVQIVHRVSGIQVKCQITRNQGKNRQLARLMLVEKLEASIRADRAKRVAAAEKLRRQSRVRSRMAKQRILVDKARHSEKKANRRIPSSS